MPRRALKRAFTSIPGSAAGQRPSATSRIVMKLSELTEMAKAVVGPNYIAAVVPVVVECAQVTIKRAKGNKEGVRFPANKLRDAITARGLRIVYERHDEQAKEWFFAIEGRPFRSDSWMNSCGAA
jgi:hypothetical protein